MAYFPWQRLPNRQLPRQAVPRLVPDLGVEVISASNTSAEMRRKLHEYFEAGVQIVWYIDPASRTVRVHHSELDSVELSNNDMLTGDIVLPGFEIDVRQLFSPTESTQ